MPTRVHFAVVFAAIIVGSALIASGCSTPTPPPTPTPTPGPGTPTPVPEPPTVVPNAQFGITWSTNFRTRDVLPQPPSSEAPAAGATWDRWPFEWTRIEYDTASQELFFIKDPYDIFEESWNYDSVVEHDQSAGLKILGVLNGMPESKYCIAQDEVRRKGVEIN